MESGDLLTAKRVIAKQKSNTSNWMCLTVGITGGFNVRLQSPSQLKPSNHLSKSRASSQHIKPCFQAQASVFVSSVINLSVFLLVLLNVLGPISLTAQPLRGIAPWWWKEKKEYTKKKIHNELIIRVCHSRGDATAQAVDWWMFFLMSKKAE